MGHKSADAAGDHAGMDKLQARTASPAYLSQVRGQVKQAAGRMLELTW